MKGRILAITVAVATSSIALADDDIPPVVGGRTYTQHLAVAAKARHPHVTSIRIEGARDGDPRVVVLGDTAGAAHVFQPVANPDTALGGTKVGGSYVVRTPFKSNSGHRLGTIAVTFPARAGAATAPLDAEAGKIADEIARVTLSAKNAADPYPYSAKFGSNTYAQALTQKIVAKHPDLLVMMIHATPPGGDKNVIIGSNIGRFGKIADDDDARVIDKGETNLEVGGDKDRFETELPLNDATGKRIGALGLVFPYKDGEDKEAIHRHGLAIRDEIATHIPNSAALFRPAR